MDDKKQWMVEDGEKRMQIFLNRINWKVSTEDIAKIHKIQVDTYLFSFKPPLEGECLAEFTQFMQKLNMKKLKSIMMIWVWLYQHNVTFKTKFRYNPNMPLRYNIKRFRDPGKLHKQFLSYGHDDIMACPLDKCLEGE